MPRTSFLITALFFVVITLGTALYVFRCEKNPPGFFIDESSIAYNAYTISQTGQDEFGKPWPLFFRAFGDYKNPTYIYLLALFFKLAGPSIFTARLLSALCGVTTALLVGLLAIRCTKRRESSYATALLVLITAFLSPWLFELSRVTLEVALFPTTIAFFLLAVQRAAHKNRWGWRDVLTVASSLTLVTYTYSIGRMLAPLLAAGLVIFFSQERLAGLIRTWAIYLLTLIPLLSFQRQNRGALTDRFYVITYMKPGTTLVENIWQFFKHYAANVDPTRLFRTGDPTIYQVTHLYNQPALLIVTLLLLVIGIWTILRRPRIDPWWRFILYGAVVSVIPASLTVEYFHELRLSALPVFILLLTVPALDWLLDQRREIRTPALALILLLTLLQGAYFQYRYQLAANDPWRRHIFDADYEDKIFKVALAQNSRPIYLADAISTPYIQAYWYATINGFPRSQFVRLKDEEVPPFGSVVIATEGGCLPKSVIAQVDPYSVYLTGPAAEPRAALPVEAFRAEIALFEDVLRFQPGQPIEMNVAVKNTSNQVWPGCQRGPATFQLYLSCHWLDNSGNWAREEGRAPLSEVLRPGQSTTLKFRLEPPLRSGEYTIELDMLQEGVVWFGLKGSQTKKVRIVVD
jgi:4-amino-4-deoxy-L-arabinose transferase-like glycosyltransferase